MKNLLAMISSNLYTLVYAVIVKVAERRLSHRLFSTISRAVTAVLFSLNVSAVVSLAAILSVPL